MLVITIFDTCSMILLILHLNFTNFYSIGKHFFKASEAMIDENRIRRQVRDRQKDGRLLKLDYRLTN